MPRFRPSPSTMLAALALFFALGGSALAVSEAVRPQARCGVGSIRGIAAVDGEPSKGIANIGGTFTANRAIFGLVYSCGGGSPQARRAGVGIYEVRFPGNPSRTALVSGAGAESTVQAVNGVFRITLHVPGRQDGLDTPFVIALL